MLHLTPTPLLLNWACQLRALAPTVRDGKLQAQLLGLAMEYESAAAGRFDAGQTGAPQAAPCAAGEHRAAMATV